MSLSGKFKLGMIEKHFRQLEMGSARSDAW